MVFLNKKQFSGLMHVLVTGGTGFIGSHLIDNLLTQGYTIRVLRRPTSKPHHIKEKNIQFIFGDLLDKKSLTHACRHIDVVFHVAAIPRDWGPKKTFFEVNLHGTQNLLDACVQNKVPRFVFMSSAAVYGFPKTDAPIKEDFRKTPTAKYGQSKLAAEHLLETYKEKYRITVSAVRSPLVLGPRDFLITPFLIQTLQHKRMFYIGTGEQRLSVSDGRDVATCLRLCGESPLANGQVYNVKSFDTTPQQLLETLAKKLHISPPEKHLAYSHAYLLATILEGIWVLRRKPNPPLTRQKVKILSHTRLLDITKAERELHYKSKYTIDTTLNDLIAWYQEHQQLPNH
jgi:nucleoside-diphosphate-sugar epimerase